MVKMQKPFISVQNLTMSYGTTPIVRNLNFEINRGDIFVIMGMSGCGKSTVMRAMIGLNQPNAGHIIIDGTNLWNLSTDQREKLVRTFGVAYQSGALFSSMTLNENVALPLGIDADMGTSSVRNHVNAALAMVGLEKYGDFYPSEISGGMVKRAALARAIVTNPTVLFLDEPSAGLDPVRAKELDNLIYNIAHKTGTTVVMVTHELESIMTIATNSIYIDAETRTGIVSGNPHKILQTTKNKQIKDFLSRKQTYMGDKK